MAHRLPHGLAHRVPPLQLPYGRRGYVRRVRGGVEPEAVLGQAVAQLAGVYQVAVVGDGHVHVAAAAELGLGVLPGGGAGRRVADVAQRQMSGFQGGEARAVEDLRDEAHVAHGGRALPVGDGYAGRLLAAVLQRVEAEVRALGQLAGELAGVEPEDAARFLRLAFRVQVIHAKSTHLPGLLALRYPMCPPSGACASKRSRSYAIFSSSRPGRSVPDLEPVAARPFRSGRSPSCPGTDQPPRSPDLIPPLLRERNEKAPRLFSEGQRQVLPPPCTPACARIRSRRISNPDAASERHLRDRNDLSPARDVVGRIHEPATRTRSRTRSAASLLLGDVGFGGLPATRRALSPGSPTRRARARS